MFAVVWTDGALTTLLLVLKQTHVVHLATVKETPDLVMDVTVKGMFQLLEVARESPTVCPPLYPPQCTPRLF